MIGNALRVEIERTAERWRRESPLYLRAFEGSLTRADVVRYLTHLREVLRETPYSLARARDRAREIGDAALAAHYAEKVAEETGHHEWATNDLERLESQTRLPIQTELLPSAAALIRFQRATIDEDPVLFLSYTLLAEYFTVLLGPSWLELLETRCGIPKTSMSTVGNHVAADKDHVEETLESIDALVGDPRKLARMREVLAGATTCWENFFAEVLDARDAAKHVSAA